MARKIENFHLDEYRFLSNFYPCEIEFDGKIYRTVEHAFVAAKTLDKNIRNDIRFISHLGKAKQFGKKIELRPDWDDVKLDIMEELLRKKFSQPYFRDLLSLTCDDLLIEGNNWNDTYWGVCRGVGKNHLGKLLMKIRSDINGLQFN